MALSAKTGLYVAREIMPGTPASSATLAVPTKFTFEEKPDIQYPDTDTNSLDSNWHRVDGTRIVDWDAKGPWFNDECGYFLTSLLGLPTDSSTGGAYQHVFNPLDTSEALTFFKYMAIDTYQFPFAYLSSFKLLWEPKKPIEFEAKGIAQKKTRGIATQSNAFGTGKPFAGWLPVVKIGGVTSSLVSMFEVTVDRPLDPFFAGGGQYYTNMYFGKRKTKVKLKADFTGTALLAAFENSTLQSLQWTATGYGIGSSAFNTIDVTLPSVPFDKLKFDYGKPNIMLDIEAECMHDNVTGRMLQMTLTNVTANYNA